MYRVGREEGSNGEASDEEKRTTEKEVREAYETLRAEQKKTREQSPGAFWRDRAERRSILAGHP